MSSLVLDIGGTAIKSALYTSQEQLDDYRETPSDGREGAKALLSRLHNVIDHYGSIGFDRIGVSTTGQVDHETGCLVFANDNIPGYTGTQLGNLLAGHYHVPVAIENDVNAAALGEAAFGGARGTRDFLCLTFGTGVGGAIVLSGQIYRGLSGSAGEFGHIVTHADHGLPCTCGQSGCYEQYASTSALIRQAIEVNPSWVNGRLIADARDAGLPDVESVLESWAADVACGLSSLIHCFNPPLLILGGGIMGDKDIFQRVRRLTLKRTMPSFAGLAIRQAELGNQAGLYGMAWICRNQKHQGEAQ